jgi:hypothetical protein
MPLYRGSGIHNETPHVSYSVSAGSNRKKLTEFFSVNFLSRTFGPKTGEWQEAGEHCIMRSFTKY